MRYIVRYLQRSIMDADDMIDDREAYTHAHIGITGT